MTTMIKLSILNNYWMRFLCDISNNEGSGKCYLALADNTC